MLNNLFYLILFASSQLLGAFVIRNATSPTYETVESEVNRQKRSKSFGLLNHGISSEIREPLKLLEDSDKDLPLNLTEFLSDSILANIGNESNPDQIATPDVNGELYSIY